MFELSTEIRYFDVRDFVTRVSVNSGIFYSGLCRIIRKTVNTSNVWGDNFTYYFFINSHEYFMTKHKKNNHIIDSITLFVSYCKKSSKSIRYSILPYNLLKILRCEVMNRKFWNIFTVDVSTHLGRRNKRLTPGFS